MKRAFVPFHSCDDKGLSLKHVLRMLLTDDEEIIKAGSAATMLIQSSESSPKRQS